MNSTRYLDLFKNKIDVHMVVHDCNVFMHDSTPFHRSKPVKNFLQEKNVDVLDWPASSAGLDAIKNLFTASVEK